MLVIYIHGIPYMAYYSYHGHSMRLFSASFSYAFLDLVILPTATCSFHWRRVSYKPACQRFSVEVMPSILPTTCVYLVATWYEHNSTFQRLYIRVAFFLLFIMHVNYINNEARDFLRAQQNHVCCKKLKRLRKQWIAPLNVPSYRLSYLVPYTDRVECRIKC